jgi:hypothetical protein
MIKFTALATAIVVSGCAGHIPYVKVGAGYKLKESDIIWQDGNKNHPISARIELGVDKGPWSYGYSHHSQWLTGWPVDNGLEYSKHEVFIDYKWKFNEYKKASN